MLEEILVEGVKSGVFSVTNIHHWALVVDNAIHGLDVPYIRNQMIEDGIDKEMLKEYTCRMIIDGIRIR